MSSNIDYTWPFQEWNKLRSDSGLDPAAYSYVDKKSAFDAVDPDTTDYLFGETGMRQCVKLG